MFRTPFVCRFASLSFSISLSALILSPCRADSPPGLAAAKADASLLDEVGRFAQPVPESDYVSWKREIKLSGPPNERHAWLHVRLGAYDLAQTQAPDAALCPFLQPRPLP